MADARTCSLLTDVGLGSQTISNRGNSSDGVRSGARAGSVCRACSAHSDPKRSQHLMHASTGSSAPRGRKAAVRAFAAAAALALLAPAVFAQQDDKTNNLTN